MRLCIGYSVIYTVYYIVEFKQTKKKSAIFSISSSLQTVL